MHKVTFLWFLLSVTWCTLEAKKYVAQSSQHVYAKEEGGQYQSNHYEYEHTPYPYRFGYDIKDEKGNVQYHKEEGDEYNVKKGSYGYTDSYGVYRHVDYIADHLGFRAKIRTNEPGTANYHPAHVTIYSEQPPSHVYSSYNKHSNSAYQQSEHEAYDKNSQATVYQQPEHAGYGNSGQEDYYEEPVHSNYVSAEHRGVVKPEYEAVSPQGQNNHEENYPKQDQKYTYVPVYVSNNVEYKN